MAVLPLTPLSLTASLNLYYLSQGFQVLNNDNNFFVDCGSFSTLSEGLGIAFDEAPDQPFVFWHEQCEEQLHLHPDKPMPIYYGVSREDASDQEILDVGKKLVAFLGENGFSCDWKDRDTTSAIFVNMNSHKPPTIEDEEEDELDLEVRLYLQENEDTKDFCWNENDLGEGSGDGYYFYQQINDGESLRDAILRLDQKVWKHITHYQMCICIDSMTEDLSQVYEINESVGFFGAFPSLYDELLKGLGSEDSTEDKFKKAEEKYYFLGHKMLELDDFKGAISAFSELIKINPSDKIGYHNRAYAKYHLEDFEGAIADYSEAIELDPEGSYYMFRGEAKFALEDSQGAIADYSKAIELDPKFYGYYSKRALAKYHLEDFEGAIADYSKAIELDPISTDKTDLYKFRGEAKFDMEDFGGAIADFTKAIEDEEKDRANIKSMGFSEISPSSSTTYEKRGVAKYHLGDFDGAITDSTEAIELNPNNAKAYYLRADAKSKIEDHEGAIADLNKAKELGSKAG